MENIYGVIYLKATHQYSTHAAAPPHNAANTITSYLTRSYRDNRAGDAIFTLMHSSAPD